MALQGIRFRTEATPATNSTSELSAAVNSSAILIPVDDKDDFVVGQNIKLGTEEMHINSITGLNNQDLLSVTRGVNGTDAAAHSNTNEAVLEDTSPTYTPSRMPDMDIVENTNYKGITVTQSYGGKVYTNERFGKQLQYEFNYTNLSSSDKAILETLFNVLKGRKTSFYMSPDSGSTFYNVRFTADELKFTQTAYNIYSVSFALLQEAS